MKKISLNLFTIFFVVFTLKAMDTQIHYIHPIEYSELKKIWAIECEFCNKEIYKTQSVDDLEDAKKNHIHWHFYNHDAFAQNFKNPNFKEGDSEANRYLYKYPNNGPYDFKFQFYDALVMKCSICDEFREFKEYGFLKRNLSLINENWSRQYQDFLNEHREKHGILDPNDNNNIE